MLYYLEPRFARRFYALSLHDSAEFRAMRGVPMLEERGAVWAKVEILRRAKGQQGMPVQRSNQFGRASDFSLLESASPEKFRSECEVFAHAPLSSPVDELLREAHDAGITIAVVEMPMTAEHRRRFYETSCWPEYVGHVRTLMNPYNVVFVDSSDWVENDSLFQDALHLSGRGAAQFTERLGRLLGPKLGPGSE
jgi:hypothetical protein